MAFTTSSTFESIKISFYAQENRITRIYRIVSMGIAHHQLMFRISFDRGYNGSDRLNATEQAHLTTLQDIYASANGFRNASNSVLTPSVSEFPVWQHRLKIL